ncbi:CinA family protein [Marinomonas pollencensis]|uniref:Nicotinamide-nucleotide amidase n=1 Tax=Marinomonas pollencensis TaxID=491954 RepID=A0A3E0DFM2_9GAMM|nr:CinA family protein [Marinomonas pollencensis]REG81492.1 nicotinamide-nucleotide amidase [Marinomonas pollencensis]
MNQKQEMTNAARQAADELQQRGWQLVTAESCTGGLIGAVCTELSGSSAWFFGGVISYANEAKENALSVSHDTLQSEGAVSAATVKQMCAGALSLGGDVAVAVSGVAGPTGGSQEKPVGCVYIAWKIGNNAAEAVRFQFSGDRQAIREATVIAALEGVAERIKDGEK